MAGSWNRLRSLFLAAGVGLLSISATSNLVYYQVSKISDQNEKDVVVTGNDALAASNATINILNQKAFDIVSKVGTDEYKEFRNTDGGLRVLENESAATGLVAFVLGVPLFGAAMPTSPKRRTVKAAKSGQEGGPK